jgi:hypothetical protein
MSALPFLLPESRSARIVAVAVIARELLTLSWLRSRFFGTGFLGSFISATFGGAIIAAVGAARRGSRLTIRLISLLVTSTCLGTRKPRQRTLLASSAFH